MGLLRQAGLRLSLGDFGTGYFLLAYLKRRPVYKINIDHSFVHGMLNDAGNAAIVGTIITPG